MSFKAGVETAKIEVFDENLFEGNLWVGFEQSFYIQDYSTRKFLPRKKSKVIAKQINREIWDSLLAGELSNSWKDHILKWVLEEEYYTPQYELQFPFPFFAKNFEGFYKTLKIMTKRLYEVAKKRGVLISTVPVVTNNTTFLTDNHITISHLGVSLVDAYNNLRACIPELLARSANSPIFHEAKSERNLLIDDLFSNQHVGPRIKSVSEYERFEKNQNADKNRLLKTKESHSTDRKMLKVFVKDVKSGLLKVDEEIAKKMTELDNILPRTVYEVHTPAPKSLDVCIKHVESNPRVELTIPDGSTCAHDIVFNAVMTMSAAYTPANSKLPQTLDMHLLQGMKTYTSITGEVYQVADEKEILRVWRGLEKIDRKQLLEDPLALLLYLKDKGTLFKANVQKLYDEKLNEWKVPQEIREKIKGLVGGESPANVYERMSEPDYKAFENLSQNITWIER